MSDETIEMELPRWMVEELRAKAYHDAMMAKTEHGRKDSEQIQHVLSRYLEEDED